MLRDRMYHSLLEYPPPLSYIDHQLRLRAELSSIQQNQTIHQELDRRKLFHNFVSEKAQQAKLMGCLQEEADYRDYLGRIDRLRRERQQLGRDKMLIKLAQTYNTAKLPLFQSDHCVNLNIENSKPATPQPVRLSESLKRTLVEPSAFKIENEKTFTPGYKFKGKLAHHITNRWVPPHLHGEVLENGREKKENESWFSQIQKQMNSIRNRINMRNQKSQINELQMKKLQEGIKNYSLSKKRERITEKKNVSFIDSGPQQLKTLIQDPSKGSKNDKQKKYEALQRSYLQIVNKKQLKSHDSLIEVKQNPPKFHSQKNSPKKKREKKNKNEEPEELDKHGEERLSSAIKKIKNRMDLSMIVYEDSEHRTINHEKMHLANTYTNECKLRKEMVGRICGAKCVSQRYNLILT